MLITTFSSTSKAGPAGGRLRPSSAGQPTRRCKGGFTNGQSMPPEWRAGVACRASQQEERPSQRAGWAVEGTGGGSLSKLARVVVVGHVGTGRAGDLHAQAFGEPPGCLRVDAVRLRACQHHHRDGDGGQGRIVGQISLVEFPARPRRRSRPWPVCAGEGRAGGLPSWRRRHPTKRCSCAAGGPPAVMACWTSVVTAPRAQVVKQPHQGRLVQDRAADPLRMAERQAQGEARAPPPLLP